MSILRAARFDIQTEPADSTPITVKATIRSKPYEPYIVDPTDVSLLVSEFRRKADRISLAVEDLRKSRVINSGKIDADNIDKEHRELGTRLLEVLLQDQRIKGAFEATLHESSIESSPVFVCEINTNDPNYLSYPWEACAYADWNALGIDKPSSKIAIVRTPTYPNLPWPISEPVNLFVAPTAPKEKNPPDFDQEYEAIIKALDSVKRRREIIERPAEVDEQTLRKAISGAKSPHIIHLVTHGDAGYILLGGEKDSKAKRIDGNVLDSMLAGARETLCLLVLSSCSTLAIDLKVNGPWMGEILSKRVPFTIGMQYKVCDEAAEIFSAGLYSSLASSSTILRAYVDARDRVIAKLPGFYEWIAPMLICGARDYKDKLVFALLDIIPFIDGAIAQITVTRKKLVGSPRNQNEWKALKHLIDDIDERLINGYYQAGPTLLPDDEQETKDSFDIIEKEVRKIRGHLVNVEDILSRGNYVFRVERDFGKISSKLLDRLRFLSVELSKLAKRYKT